MQNGIFKLNWLHLIDAVLTAVVAAVIAAAVVVVSSAGFDIFTADWTMIGHTMANVGVFAGVVTLGKTWLSTTSGSLLNVGPTA